MANPRQLRNLILNLSLGAATAALAIAFMLVVVATQPVQAQTFQVIHTFTGGQDGGNPWAGLTMDKAGNLYGTAYNGGIGYGTVYQLKRKNSNWTFNPLFNFNGSDGANPQARVIFGPNGTLYGTTIDGGTANFGTVFNLRPPATACKTALCPWTETVLYSFPGGADGAYPGLGDLFFDSDIYGTTSNGGNFSNCTLGCGVVYEVAPKSSGGYPEKPLYAFSGNDGEYPLNGVIFDNAGNLYGTTNNGGLNNFGTVFELTPQGGGRWTESCLYSFHFGSDGAYPLAGLIFDQSGNLFGATFGGGTRGGGTVFELTPSANCTWTVKTLYSFDYGCGPPANLVMDGAGNLYGTRNCGGAHNAGNVWELTPSGGSWTYTSLYDFTGGSDGFHPSSNVVIDAKGNLYGTTVDGGIGSCRGAGCGVVWEITP